MNLPDPIDASAELFRLRHRARLTQRQIALATGVKPGVVTGWLRGTRRPRGERADRLLLLAACVEELSRYLSPRDVAAWLARPLPLDEATPLALIAAGEVRRMALEIAAACQRAS
ncbi:MAG TPA: helix-turn-helix transcriptional regulator [Candidatus Limnocylindrales bacterium]